MPLSEPDPTRDFRPGLARSRDRGFLRPGGVLSREAEHAILGLLEQISEGQVVEGQSPEGQATEVYFGSAMFSIELAALARCWRGPLNEARLERAVGGSVRLRIALLRRAMQDAKVRRSDRAFGTFATETVVRVSDGMLQIDLDLEATVDERVDGKHSADRNAMLSESGDIL